MLSTGALKSTILSPQVGFVGFFELVYDLAVVEAEKK